MQHAFLAAAAVAMAALTLAGCAFLDPAYPNARYKGDKYIDPREPSKLGTTGIESSDLKSASSHLVGKILASPQLANTTCPPVYDISPGYFEAGAIDDFDTAALADLLRNDLINAAEGRVRVMANCDGTATGIQYEVGGRITEVSQQARGLDETYVQMVFHVVDANTHEIVLSDAHSFKKAALAGAGAWK